MGASNQSALHTLLPIAAPCSHASVPDLTACGRMQAKQLSHGHQNTSVTCLQVIGAQRTALVDPPSSPDDKGHPLVLETLHATGKNYPLLAARATVGPVAWLMQIGSHTMRSTSSSEEPSFIFSMVDEKNPELFYCVVMQKREWHRTAREAAGKASGTGSVSGDL